MPEPIASSTTRRERIFSGMQPTGGLHLGNYLGALANWVTLASQHDSSLFCVVDQHAQTVKYNPREMTGRVFEMALAYLAAGVDPSRSIVFVQSAVPEHTELAWYLSTVTQFGELSRMTQFKDKSETEPENINAALFTYPVLMAADVLLYKTTLVPVGEDQVQHLELARDVAHRFNARYGETFPQPKAILSSAPRIMGVDGLRKMSKSLGNDIGMLEDDKAIFAKLRPAFTDPQRLRRTDPGRPEVCNIFKMHTAVTPEADVRDVEHKCRTAGFGCGDCKIVLARSLTARLDPIRARAAELRAHPQRVHDVLADGARRARAITRETIVEVRDRMGIAAPPAGERT